MNPMNLMKIKNLMEQFKQNHPKVPLFLQTAGQHIGEGSVIEVSVTTEEGKNFCTNMKVTAEDMKLVEQLKKLSQ